MLNSTKYTISVQNTKRLLFSRNAHIEAESRPNKQISVLFQIHKYKYKLEWWKLWCDCQREIARSRVTCAEMTVYVLQKHSDAGTRFLDPGFLTESHIYLRSWSQSWGWKGVYGGKICERV